MAFRNFYADSKNHENFIRNNPKRTLIIDAIALGVVVVALVIFLVLIFNAWGWNFIMVLPLVLFGCIIAGLIISIIQCAKRMAILKAKKEQEGTKE